MQTAGRAWPEDLFVRRISFWKSRMVFVAPWWIYSGPPNNENVSLRSKIESLVGRWGTRKVAHRIEPLGQAEIADQGSP